MALYLVTAPSNAGSLKPFSTDGCSLFPEGTPTQQTLWLSCCTAHDRAYWLGGSYEERVSADKALAICVEKTGEKEIALLMQSGVRAGGSPYWPTAFRWGYGWPYLDGLLPRGYKIPDPGEQQQILLMMKKADG